MTWQSERELKERLRKMRGKLRKKTEKEKEHDQDRKKQKWLAEAKMRKKQEPFQIETKQTTL